MLSVFLSVNRLQRFNLEFFLVTLADHKHHHSALNFRPKGATGSVRFNVTRPSKADARRAVKRHTAVT